MTTTTEPFVTLFLGGMLQFAQQWIDDLSTSYLDSETLASIAKVYLVKASHLLYDATRATDAGQQMEAREALRQTFRWCALVANMVEEGQG